MKGVMCMGIIDWLGNGFNSMAASAGLIAMSLIVGSAIPKVVKSTGIAVRAWLSGQISAIEDPEVREIILKAIFVTQKKFASDSGKARMKRVIKIVQDIIPGRFDDQIIEVTIQAIYNEALIEIK